MGEEGIRQAVLRKYESVDCPCLAQLFYDTVHTVNARDYSEEQLAAWADKAIDIEAWNRSFWEHHTYVAVRGGRIVGFGDIDDTGYLDRLYIHKDHQEEGIGTVLCDKLESMVNVKKITTHASITARPFFEKRGYRVIREQQVERKGILLTNYVMEKEK